jgi:primosomal protein N'
MNRGQLHNMYRKVRGVLSEHRSGPARHTSERDPAYLKLMMMEQALAEKIYEDEMAAANTAAPAPGVNPQQAAAMAVKQKMDQKTQIQKELEDLKKQVTDKQNELNDLNSTTSVQEHRRAQTYGYYLSESEVQQAQVVLAAQDMVDKMQGMIEDTTEMQFKELPALVDSIKNQIGADQAAQFNNDAQAALTGLVQNLQGSKQQLEQALGVVTGQGPVEMPGTEMAPPPAGEEQPDLSMAAPSPEEELDAAAVGPAASLGRERR